MSQVTYTKSKIRELLAGKVDPATLAAVQATLQAEIDAKATSVALTAAQTFLQGEIDAKADATALTDLQTTLEGEISAQVSHLLPIDVNNQTPFKNPFIPADVKIRGVNFTPHPNHREGEAWDDGDGYDLQSLWTNQSDHWEEWWLFQFDIAGKLGCNTVRTIGNVTGVLRERITLNDMLANITRYCQEARKRGLWVYATLGGGDLSLADFTLEAKLAVYYAVAAEYAKHPNVIAIDGCNEWNISNAGIDLATFQSDYLSPLADAVRAVTDKPFTFSFSGGGEPETLWNTAAVSDINPLVDYFDFHVYQDASFSDPELFHALGLGKLFIMGEGGANNAGESEEAIAIAQTKRIKSLARIARRPSCLGYVAWAAADQDTVAGNQWGFYDNDGVERTAKTAPFFCSPKRRDSVEIEIRVLDGAGAQANYGISTGAYTSPTNMTATITLVKPVRARITSIIQYQCTTATPSVYNFQVTINGVSIANDLGNAESVVGSTHNATDQVTASSRHTEQLWPPGTYTVAALVGVISGDAGTLLYPSKIILELIPID